MNDIEFCCDEVKESVERFGTWNGGSHYHCGNCNEVAGMYGHFHSIHFVKGKIVKVLPHFGCSDKCSNRLDITAPDVL